METIRRGKQYNIKMETAPDGKGAGEMFSRSRSCRDALHKALPRNIILSLLIVVLLISCSTSSTTPISNYEQYIRGASEVQLAENVFTIKYRSHDHQWSSDKTIEYALLRSADVAIHHGFKYFTIANADEHVTQEKILYEPSSPTIRTSGSVNQHGGFSAETTVVPELSVGGPDGRKIARGSLLHTLYKLDEERSKRIIVTLGIVCYSEKPDGFVIEAATVVDSLKKKYRIIGPVIDDAG